MTEPYVRSDVAAFLAAGQASGAPAINELPVAEARAAIRAMGRVMDLPPEPLAVVRDLACGAIPLRFYDARAVRDPGPLILFFHGGGFVFGDLDSHDSFCRFIAQRCDLPVLAVDYRLAPEHPFPAFAQDAEEVARWAAAGPQPLGHAPTGLITCGDSAGGHMAVLVAQRLGAIPAERPVLAQWAFYPFLGAGDDWPSFHAFGEGYMLTRAAMDWFDALCGKPEGDERYNLLLGPVPSTPLLIQTAALDPLSDPARFYADKGRAAGAKVVQIEAEGMIHGYVNMRAALPSAQQDVENLLAAGLALLED
ncbi:alpha/beta hydrolase [Novosphingobium sp. KACC 22771]|uniref:alpha/beta hydrolase n=1 Tax=Novosphingobium sp. KACC 22771 TaxID=3025670 RepID=UPI0023660E0F|nr:alpha/beta hydrolase [Novosphingobium sp. KACC 22771]WDF75115.1 alpha/beta hydrolase [Novosphingobium sp. KACC 22771]